MDSRIKHEHIANEAQRICNIFNRQDNEANWYDAIDNLKIFPERRYVINRLSSDEGDYLFGIVRSCFTYNVIYWYYCREMFERDLFASNNEFGFVFSPTLHDQEYRVANFIRNIELDQLNLGELTTFMRMANKSLIYVRPSTFWTSCQMRFSLFTILMKAGRYYFFNTIEDALTAEPYAKSTIGAIRAFFNGRRNYTGNIPDWRTKWVSMFQNRNESEIGTLAY